MMELADLFLKVILWILGYSLIRFTLVDDHSIWFLFGGIYIILYSFDWFHDGY